MVVTEINDNIFFFEQHEHAQLCGRIAEEWRDEYFFGEERRKSVEYAIYEHDNGWIELDRKPIFNQKSKLPYSFVDHPLKAKLHGYTVGIDRIEEKDRYAALLCSLHYCSFFESYTNGRGKDFLTNERKRQEQLREALSVEKNDVPLKFHYDLLQFCDNLSLYLCMNRPGVLKKDEFIWFRNGFSQRFAFNNYKRIIAHWLDENTVTLNDFPFKKEVELAIRYKVINRRNLDRLEEEYDEARYHLRVVTIVKG